MKKEKPKIMHSLKIVDQYHFKNVPRKQQKLFFDFQKNHPYSTISIQNKNSCPLGLSAWGDAQAGVVIVKWLCLSETTRSIGVIECWSIGFGLVGPMLREKKT